jgi:hypothetical protein
MCSACHVQFFFEKEGEKEKRETRRLVLSSLYFETVKP